MTDADKASLKRILASFDEAGLVALTNKGLVRRATKDLEAGGLQIEEQDACVRVRGPDWTVTMPVEGPRKAQDDTRATGVTRQILMATIHLRDHWSPTGDTPAIVDESKESKPKSATSVAIPESPSLTPTDLGPIPTPTAMEDNPLEELETQLAEISPEQLQKWAGKEAYREAFRLVESGRLEVERRADLTLRLLDHEIEVRIFPGPSSVNTLLDQALATAPKAARKRWVATAVLAWHRHLGKQPQNLTVQAPEAAEQAPRDRQELLAVAGHLLESLVATGLAHPSERSSERLITLSISSLGLHLPRLARILRAIADEWNLLLERDAQADTSRLLENLAFAYALVRALRNPGALTNPVLVGQHRTEYEPVGDLTLIGVAAFPWQSASGFEGLTVLFWDEKAHVFRSWSYTRPLNMRGRSPIDLIYQHEVPWSGGGSPEKFARSRLILRSARMNPQGRLSASQASRVEGLEACDPTQIDFTGRSFASWSALADYLPRAFPLGLAESQPMDRYVVLRPTTWGPRVYDEVHQRFTWLLLDEQSRPLLVSLPWTEVNESTIAFLEEVKVDRERLTSLLARIQFDDGMRFEPVSLIGEGNHLGEKLFHPAFDMKKLTTKQATLLERLREKYGRDRLTTTVSPDEDLNSELAVVGSWDGFPPGIQGLLVDLSSRLLHLAESGSRRWEEATSLHFQTRLQQLSHAGIGELPPLPTAAAAIPAWLLILTYHLRLYREASLRSQFTSGN